jgi:DNA polymerase III subunit delta
VTVIREDQLGRLLERQIATLNGILVYGDDQAAAENIAVRIAQKISGDTGAALRLEASAINSDPAILIDEFRATSLLGDRRAMIVSGAGETVLKHLQPVINATFIGNFIVLVAGSLNKSSKLRSALEASNYFAVLPLYEARQQDLAASLDEIMKANGMSLDPEARQVFFELVGNERTLVLQEAAKLAIYAQGQKTISRNDVIAACGDLAETAVSDLIEDVLGGNIAAIEAMSSGSGDDEAALRNSLPLFNYHLSQLQLLQLDRASGKSIESAIASARPPVHFSRRKSFERQLRVLDAGILEQFQQSVEHLTEVSRKNASLSSPIVGRGLMALARKVRSLTAR